MQNPRFCCLNFAIFRFLFLSIAFLHIVMLDSPTSTWNLWRCLVYLLLFFTHNYSTTHCQKQHYEKTQLWFWRALIPNRKCGKHSKSELVRNPPMKILILRIFCQKSFLPLHKLWKNLWFDEKFRVRIFIGSFRHTCPIHATLSADKNSHVRFFIKFQNFCTVCVSDYDFWQKISKWKLSLGFWWFPRHWRDAQQIDIFGHKQHFPQLTKWQCSENALAFLACFCNKTLWTILVCPLAFGSLSVCHMWFLSSNAAEHATQFPLLACIKIQILIRWAFHPFQMLSRQISVSWTSSLAQVHFRTLTCFLTISLPWCSWPLSNIVSKVITIVKQKQEASNAQPWKKCSTLLLKIRWRLLQKNSTLHQRFTSIMATPLTIHLPMRHHRWDLLRFSSHACPIASQTTTSL